MSRVGIYIPKPLTTTLQTRLHEIISDAVAQIRGEFGGVVTDLVLHHTPTEQRRHVLYRLNTEHYKQLLGDIRIMVCDNHLPNEQLRTINEELFLVNCDYVVAVLVQGTGATGVRLNALAQARSIPVYMYELR